MIPSVAIACSKRLSAARTSWQQIPQVPAPRTAVAGEQDGSRIEREWWQEGINLPDPEPLPRPGAAGMLLAALAALLFPQRSWEAFSVKLSVLLCAYLRRSCCRQTVLRCCLDRFPIASKTAIEVGMEEFANVPDKKTDREAWKKWTRSKSYEGWKLYRRMSENSQDYLRFLDHPEIPCHNAGWELIVRQIRRRHKSTNGFRSERGARTYFHNLSIVETDKKRGQNVFDLVESVFEKDQKLTGSAGQTASSQQGEICLFGVLYLQECEQ